MHARSDAHLIALDASHRLWPEVVTALHAGSGGRANIWLPRHPTNRKIALLARLSPPTANDAAVGTGGSGVNCGGSGVNGGGFGVNCGGSGVNEGDTGEGLVAGLYTGRGTIAASRMAGCLAAADAARIGSERATTTRNGSKKGVHPTVPSGTPPPPPPQTRGTQAHSAPKLLASPTMKPGTHKADIGEIFCCGTNTGGGDEAAPGISEATANGGGGYDGNGGGGGGAGDAALHASVHAALEPALGAGSGGGGGGVVGGGGGGEGGSGGGGGGGGSSAGAVAVAKVVEGGGVNPGDTGGEAWVVTLQRLWLSLLTCSLAPLQQNTLSVNHAVDHAVNQAVKNSVTTPSVDHAVNHTVSHAVNKPSVNHAVNHDVKSSTRVSPTLANTPGGADNFPNTGGEGPGAANTAGCAATFANTGGEGPVAPNTAGEAVSSNAGGEERGAENTAGGADIFPTTRCEGAGAANTAGGAVFHASNDFEWEELRARVEPAMRLQASRH